MSLMLALSTLDLSILPVVIHGLFILLLLRRLLFEKILPIFFVGNFNAELEERSSILSRKSSRDFNRVDVGGMDEKVQETEADEAEVESRKRQSLRKNLPFGSSASVQAKMSLDLIVEQLKREMSLKDIEAESRDDAKIKVQQDEIEVDDITKNEAKSENLVEKYSKEVLKKKCYEEEDTEESSKETNKCVAKTANFIVKDASKNSEENVEENEIKDLHQRETTTISSREPVDKVCGTEEENLYGLIRSMIAAEVKRYEERERTIVRKVHSDTTDVVGRITKKRKLSLSNNENSEDIEKEENDYTNRLKISKERNLHLDSIKSKINHHHLSPNDTTAFVLERKQDLRTSFGDLVEGGINVGENVSISVEEEVSSNRETQTEREYMIRTVRSCPVRRRRRGGSRGIPFDAQHQRCGELGSWIYRKASDNLIYEKGKASESPSYVPLTQRFRWKYVRPRKAR